MRKKTAVIAIALLLIISLCVPAAAAPLEDEKFEIIPVLDFSAYADGTNVAGMGNGAYAFYGSAETTAKIQDGQFVISACDPDQKFVARFGYDNEITAEQAADMEYIGFYVENNTSNPIGIGAIAESKGGTFIDAETGEEKVAIHQMMYNSVWPEDIVYYLMDMDGNVTRPDCYQLYDDDNADGHAEIPAGFKGYFLVSLTEGGFNICLYAAWGGHPDLDCEGGIWKSGEYGLASIGITFQGEIGDGETVVVDDMFMAKGTDKFVAPGEATLTPAPTPTPAAEVSATPAAGSTTAPAAATTAPADEPDGNNNLWLYIAIGAVVVIGGIAILAAVTKNKKKADEGTAEDNTDSENKTE